MLRARNAYNSVILVFPYHTLAGVPARFSNIHIHIHTPLSSTPSIAHTTAAAITPDRCWVFVARGRALFFPAALRSGAPPAPDNDAPFLPVLLFWPPFPPFLFHSSLRSYFFVGCWLRFLRVILPPRLP